MIRFSLAGSISVVAVLVAVSMYALNVALEPPACPRAHLLFIGSGTGECWQRTVEGARDAARQLGVDLEVKMPTPTDLVDEQTSLVQAIDSGDYDGVALSPANLESQLESINNLACRTKLVTVDHDDCKSRRLCHFGYSQTSAGALVARLVRDQLLRPGKVALLATTFSNDAHNSNVSERVAGFKETWGPCGPDDAKPCPIIEVTTDSDFSAKLVDPELAFIVVFDAKAAESLLKALAIRSETRHLPIIAFDPSKAIFDAIDDGRVCSAIFDDPYRSGYTAVHSLRTYSGAEKEFLPVPGYGFIFLVSEVVSKENLADVRRRTRS